VPELAAGPAAAFTVWFLHASIDWDWQLPAVSAVAVLAAAAILALSETPFGLGSKPAGLGEQVEGRPARAVASL
jgi:hypothetical protein